ncbi:MAG: amino acid ABC transporter permease [Coriobacteriia bacterium]|nr:amino acid ABC transporter permease [Coriobacteriia bacterium]
MPESYVPRIIYLLQNSGFSFLQGALYTLVLALISTFIGCVIGFLIGILQTIPIRKKDPAVKRGLLRVMRAVLTAYVEIFRGTPMIVQAMFIYYGLAILLSKPLDVWPAAILIVSINTGAYMAETVRGGIISIPDGQVEGAKSIGMSHWQTMRFIILPQALRNILPQIGNNLIINIKDTSVLFVIGVTELFSRGKSVAGAYYVYFETFTIIMVMYFIMTFTCSRLLRVWEKKIGGPQSYELATKDQLTLTSGMYTNPKMVEDN